MPASALVLNWSGPDLTGLANTYLLIYASPPESPGRTRNARRGYKLTSVVLCSSMLNGFSYDLTADWQNRFGMSIAALTGAQIFLSARLLNSKGVAGPLVQGSALYAVQAVDPSTISGIVLRLQADVIGSLWQDSARTTPVVADGNPVGAWDSTVPSLQTLIQASAGQRPTYKSASYHGKPTIRFDGVNDNLRLIAGSNQSQGLTAYMVSTIPAAGASKKYLWAYANSAVLGDTLFIDTNGNPTINAGTDLTSGMQQTGAQVTAVVYDGTTSRIVRDGQVIKNGNAGNNSMKLLTIGADGAGSPAEFADTDISEIIWYQGAHPITLIAGISQWLQTHWA